MGVESDGQVVVWVEAADDGAPSGVLVVVHPAVLVGALAAQDVARREAAMASEELS